MANKGEPKEPQLDTWQLEEDTVVKIEDLVNASVFNQAADENGESANLGIRVPAWMGRRITKIREMPGSPYQINGDVARDALWLGLQILQLRYKTRDWDIEKKLAKVIDATGELDRINSNVNEFSKNLEKLKASDDAELAILNLEAYLKSVDTMEDAWRKRTTIKLLKRKGIVLELITHCDRSSREMMIQ